jgi:hypothetical protein
VVGVNNTALPYKTTFEYYNGPGDSGNLKRAKGGWNRLKRVDNGQGGSVTFSYDNISQKLLDAGANYYNTFFNRHRVTQALRNDRNLNKYLTTYEYTGAAVNALDTQNYSKSTVANPNSAVLYYTATAFSPQFTF